ncbi:MAG: cardiolipin synthase [Eubacteriales bacterium]|nr:cardiolipin synthase [Eubacteriales bacterium]
MKGKLHHREMNHIPVRFLIAIVLAVLETAAVIAAVMVCSYYIPYFFLLVWATEIAVVIQIIASDDNPDYKIPWLMVVLLIPVAGFMMYFLFYDRKLHKRFIRRLDDMKSIGYKPDDRRLFAGLAEESLEAHNQAKMLCNISESHLYSDTKQDYFPLGEEMFIRLLEDLRSARKFIFMEYFIIEEGHFWNSILDILKEKAAAGVEVKVVYDDIGCMMTLPGDYYRQLQKYGIDATPFSMLKGNADSEFNNRSHRKITVIDGRVGYTGGVNIADEYINEVVRFGHWKDVGLRIEGDAVKELTNLFLIDYGLNVRKIPEAKNNYFPEYTVAEPGYLIPFGDGPAPIYNRRVGKSVIQNILNQADRYVYIMSPYLIIDNELCAAIEDTALRGVTVKLILPHIPDKKLILEMARSYYKRLIGSGVEVYEYEPGFVHAKVYLADDEYGMVGTINLDYRSLVHHFENSIWMYRCECLKDMKADFADTLEKCIRIDETTINWTLPQRFLRAVLKVFAPIL